MFNAGDHCKVVRGYLKESRVVINGCCKDIFGITDVEGLAQNEKLWRNPALANYLSICLYGINENPILEILNTFCGCGDRVAFHVQEECRGIFYYGKIEGSERKVCLHPSWLEKISSEEKATRAAICDERELLEILTEIRVIQYSCDHAGEHDHMVPRRCKGRSCEKLQDKQRRLIPLMRKLRANVGDDKFEEIATKADEKANIEIETTSGCDMGSLIGAVHNGGRGCPVQ